MKKALLLTAWLLFLSWGPHLAAVLPEKASASKASENQLESILAAGVRFAEAGKYQEAIQTFQAVVRNAAPRARELHPTAYNEIGNAYSDLGNNQAAFKAYGKALALAPDTAYSLRAKINKNLGAVFLSWKNLEQAMQYYNTAQALAKKANDITTVADCFNNQGTVYEQQHNYAKALEVYRQALKIYQGAKQDHRIALTCNNLAILYKVNRQYKLASSYYKQAVDHAGLANNPWLTAAISNNLGNLLSETGQLTEADQYLQKSLRLSREIAASELVFEALENMAENASRQQDYRQAFQYHKEFSDAKHAFINSENTKEVNRLQTELTTRYEVEKKEKALAESRAALLQGQILVNKRTNLLVVAVLAVLLIGTLTVLMYRNARIRQLKLEAENLLNLQLAQAEARNKMQEEKLRISRELHDNIGSQLSFINASIQNLSATPATVDLLPETQKVAQNTMADLRRAVWLINKEEIGLEEFVVKLREYVRPLQTLHPALPIRIELEGHGTLSPSAATHLFRLVQEAINNALKYAGASLLQVNFRCENQALELSISDNGTGFDLTREQEGYGLKNMQARADALGGQLKLHSAAGEGTRIRLRFPLSG